MLLPTMSSLTAIILTHPKRLFIIDAYPFGWDPPAPAPHPLLPLCFPFYRSRSLLLSRIPMETTMLGRNLGRRLAAVANLEHLCSSPQITSGGSVLQPLGGGGGGAGGFFLLWGGHDFQPHPQSQIKHYRKNSVSERRRCPRRLRRRASAASGGRGSSAARERRTHGNRQAPSVGDYREVRVWAQWTPPASGESLSPWSRESCREGVGTRRRVPLAC
jgi:hypothetical protein